MIFEKRTWPPGRRPKTKSSLAILAISLLVLTPILAQESTGPRAPESPPESLRPEKLYTETEALAAAQEATKAALDKSVPLAVQAAVAEERGREAKMRIEDEAALLATRKSLGHWRLATLGSCLALLSAVTYCALAR